MLSELKRFEDKKLKSMESHTSPDYRSGAIGDIEIVDNANKIFEAVEIKARRRITEQMVNDAYEKFRDTDVNRYYILSTSNPQDIERLKIEKAIELIEKKHGCQLIVNGIYPTIKYYLRLLSNPTDFIKSYSENMSNDNALTMEHIKKWEELISNSD